jgi:hypothetical protein
MQHRGHCNCNLTDPRGTVWLAKARLTRLLAVHQTYKNGM